LLNADVILKLKDLNSTCLTLNGASMTWSYCWIWDPQNITMLPLQ